MSDQIIIAWEFAAQPSRLETREHSGRVSEIPFKCHSLPAALSLEACSLLPEVTRLRGGANFRTIMLAMEW
jgi:hypothetical protein